MSYCRFNEPFIENRHSTVYVLGCVGLPLGRDLECCACRRYPENQWPLGLSHSEMIAHLMGHLELGDAVPPDAINRLWIELLQYGRPHGVAR